MIDYDFQLGITDLPDLPNQKDQASNHSSGKNFGHSLPATSIHSSNDERTDHINSKLGFDNDYSWFKISQGLFTTLWLGISRTNVTILSKDKTEEIGNYSRCDFTVLSSTSNSLKCQVDDKTISFSTGEAKKIAFLLTPLMMWHIDNDGNVLNANQLFLDYLGAKPDDKLNIFDPAIVNPSDYQACYAAFVKGKAEMAPFSTTRGLKCHNGKFYTYTAKAVPEFDSEGNVSSWYGTCFAEQASTDQTSSKSYRKLSATNRERENDGKINQINSKLGFDKDYSWFKVSQGIFTTFWLGISRTNVTILNKDKTEEIGNYARSNFTVQASSSNSIKCQANGKTLCFSSAEAKKIAFLLTPLMMWQVDNDGNVLTANQLFLDFLGAKANDKLNIFDPSIVNPSDYQVCAATFAQAKIEKYPFSTTRGLKCHDGKYYTYTAKAVPEFDNEGNISSWYGTCFAEQAKSKDFSKKSDSKSLRPGSKSAGQKLPTTHENSAEEEKINLINSKLGFDKDYTWFKISQGLFSFLWLGISRTNVTILNKDKTEEEGNYPRSDFTVISSTSTSLKCQVNGQTLSFNTPEAKKIAFLLTPLMMWQIDNDGNVLNANQMFIEYLGAKTDDKLNIFDPAIVNPSDYQACCAAFAKGKAEKSPFAITRGLKSHNGKYYTFTAKAIPEFDSDGNVSSWYGTCFSEQATGKDFQKKSVEQSSITSSPAHSLQSVNSSIFSPSTSFYGQKLSSTPEDSAEEGKINLINSKLGFDKDYIWFKVGQGMFTTLWLGISRTNVTILSKDKSEVVSNYARSNFFVMSSTSNCIKCQAEEKTFNFNSAEAKKIAFLLTPLMMWQVDNEGNVLTANQLFLDFLGAKADDKLNIFAQSVVSPSDYDACCQAFAKGKLEKSPFAITRGLKCHDGKYYNFTAKAVPELDSEGNISSWYGTCFAEQTAGKDRNMRSTDLSSAVSSPAMSTQSLQSTMTQSYMQSSAASYAQRLAPSHEDSAEEEKINLLNSKLGFDKDYSWFKVGQGFKTLWLGISRTNITILNKNKNEEIGNFARSDFNVVSSTSNSLKCQVDEKTINFSTIEAKKIAFLLTPLMMWQIDNDGNVLTANQLFLDFLGAKANEKLNIFDPSVVNPSDFQACSTLFSAGKSNKRPFTVTRGLKCHDGKYYTYTAKAIPELDSDGNISSWYGTCFAEQAPSKDLTRKAVDVEGSMISTSSINEQKLAAANEDSAEEEKIYLLNSKLGFDKDFTWFKVGQGLFTTLWLGISRTNVTILNKDKSEEIGNFARSNFTVVSSTSNSLKCQVDDKTLHFSTADAKKIAFLLTPLMMWQIDNYGNVLNANQLFLDFLGAKDGEDLNIFDRSVVSPADYKSACYAFAKGKVEKAPFTTTRGLKCYDGKFYTYTAKAIPEFDSDGNVSSWYGTCFAEQNTAKDAQKRNHSGEQSSIGM